MSIRSARTVLLALAALAACGGSGDGGTGPDSGGGGAGAGGGGGGNGGGGGGGSNNDRIVSISVTPNALTLEVGATATLSAEGTTEGGQRVSTGFSWRTANAAVATVGAAGQVTAVAPGTTSVQAVSGSVQGAATVTVPSPPVPPAAPSDLEARELDATSVELTWTDNSTDETGFEIERAPAGGAYVVVGTAAADSTTFRDTSVPAPGVWSYRLRALRDSLASAFTEAVELEVSTVAPVRRAVARIEDVVDSLIPSSQTADNRDLPGELLALAPVLVEDPDILAVLVDSITATAQVVLKSGLSVLIMNNKVPFAGDLAAAAAVRDASRFDGPSRTTSGSTDAGLVSIGGGASVASVLRSVLSDGGYATRQLDGSVEAFRQFKGLGALYLDSHAAGFLEVEALILDQAGDVTEWDSGDYAFGIETETVIWESDLDRYIDELFDGELIISISTWPGGLGPRRAKLAVTETFIQRHWRLEDAIVILHICFGGAGAFTSSGTCFGACARNDGNFFDATRVRQSIVDAGAQVVLAYDNYVWPTTSRPSMECFFDRLSGANTVAPMATPPRRPFDLARVRSAMAQQGLLVHQKGGRLVNARFETAFPDEEIVGVPTVEQIVVTDDAARSDGELRLSGVFSDFEGTLTVGGAPATIQSWSGTSIVARTPFAGNGATGDVVVKSPGGLRSNAVPMTEWRGAITFSVEPNAGTLKGTLEANVIFRADVHKPRTSVEGDPIAVPVATYLSPATFAQVRGTGSNTDANGTVEFFGADEARILTKAEVDEKVGGLPNATERFFGGQVTFDTEARTARICFSGAGPVRVRETSADGGVAEFEAPLLGTLYPDLFDELDGLMGCLNLPMNDAFTIPAGRRVVNAGEGPDAVTLTLDWTDFTASNAPDDETKG